MECPTCGSSYVKKHGLRYGSQVTAQRFICLKCKHSFSIRVDHLEIVEANVKLAKQKQRLQDLQRIERKSFREYARVENAVAEYSAQLKELFERHSLVGIASERAVTGDAVGVIQISDTHFNELVDLAINQYDFGIASVRLREYIGKAKLYFSLHNISNVLVALTGDLLNSDRRIDELLSNSVNRAKATFLGVDLLRQVILDLNEQYNVSVACVSGNESRIMKDWSWVDAVATENYDFTIFNILRYLFSGAPGISFIAGDPLELVVEVAGQNVLLMHGNGSVNHSQLEKSISQIMGRYAARGIILRYILFGHNHSARVGDCYARSSSLIGQNVYSEKALNLVSRASQNCFVFYENGNVDSIKIDLQNPGGPGYDIDKSLEAYNPKSSDKTKKKEVIFQVVV